MLASILVWSYVGLLSLVYGLFSIYLLQKLSSMEEPITITISLFVAAILGLVVLTTFASILSLFIQMGLLANLLFLVGAIVILLFKRQMLVGLFRVKFQHFLKINTFIYFAMAVILLVILARSTEFPYNFDTGLYHAQTIHWFEEYRVIPGLGNIYWPLALNSSWLLTSALFSFSFLGFGSFHNLGGLLSLFIAAYSLVKLGSLIRGELSLSYIAPILTVFFLRRFFLVQLSSPGTDLPATLIVWLVFLISIEKIDKGETTLFNTETLLILIFSMFVITVKLSTLPILVLPLYFLIREISTIPTSKKLLVPSIAILLLAPWLIRGFIQSGYLIYPFFQIDLFQVDWKIPKPRVEILVNEIKRNALFPKKDMDVLKMPAAQWIPSWFRWQNSLDRQLFYMIGIGIPLSAFISLVYGWKYKNDRSVVLRYLIILFTAIIGIVFWFIEAPKTSYGYGFLIILACILLSQLFYWIINTIKIIYKPLAYLFLIGIISYWGVQFYKMKDLSQFNNRLVLPVDYPHPPVKALQWDSTSIFYVPTSGVQCYYYAFPCVPARFSGVIKRGYNLSDGFKYAPGH